MNMLKQILEKKAVRDSKLKNRVQKPKEQNEPKTDRPLSRVFGFLQNRQEVRLGIIYSIFDRNQSLEGPGIEEPKKVEVSYIG